MIKLEKVNKYFNRHKKNQIHVIKNTSLEFKDKGLVALLGPSGCGKTTLLNTTSGLDKANNGKIYINGKRITKRRSYYVDKVRNLNIGYIFQDYNLVNNLTVFDNVALVLKINGIKDKEEIKKRVNYCLEKVGMYRYRNRYASMLSGGEKQRVGIARAIVKDPNIIFADEPTGNLDSKNTIEVMNIIKSISKNRLVLLVTHEKPLADFYADRIIELKDGEVISDKLNEHDRDLDYKIDNKIYLRDLKYKKELKVNDIEINYYSNTEDKQHIDIVYQNGNLYIQSNNNIEVVDNNSSITLLDENYKKISKSDYEKYNFDFEKIINKSIKYKYSSVFNIFTLISNGFKKVRDYPFVKKLLLLGFFASGLFITNAFSNALGVTKIKDEDFITYNRNYITVENKKVNIETYKKYENDELVNYILPGNSNVSFYIKYEDYYQTSQTIDMISGSLSSSELINNNDIIHGRNIENNNEIVLDILTVKRYIENSNAKQAGILSYKDLLNKKIYVNNMEQFLIVGFTDKKDPSIYTNKSNFINIIYNMTNNYTYDDKYDYDYNESNFIDYNLVKDKISLIKGKYPENDYEVILSSMYKDEYKLNKEIDTKINNTKLKVVGFYDSDTIKDKMLVSNNTIKYDLINNKEGITIYAKDKKTLINNLLEDGLNANDSYEKSKLSYINERKDSVKSSLIVCLIILLISVIEIYLMIRSSFLSRIKEIGIYRAIGMKKTDIRKMFAGEIIAITTIGSLTGALFMAFIIKQLSSVNYFSNIYLMNYKILIIIIIFIYLFNLIIGLLPVNKVLRQTPSKILSRTDI